MLADDLRQMAAGLKAEAKRIEDDRISLHDKDAELAAEASHLRECAYKALDLVYFLEKRAKEAEPAAVTVQEDDAA